MLGLFHDRRVAERAAEMFHEVGYRIERIEPSPSDGHDLTLIIDNVRWVVHTFNELSVLAFLYLDRRRIRRIGTDEASCLVEMMKRVTVNRHVYNITRVPNYGFIIAVFDDCGGGEGGLFPVTLLTAYDDVRTYMKEHHHVELA